MTTYRTGNRNPRNIYRVTEHGEEHIGCMFDPADGPRVVEALNREQPALCLTWIGGAARMCELRLGHEGDHEPSCTDEWQPPHRAGSRPNMCATCSEGAPTLTSSCLGCNVARRNPGRTCPRHGAVS